MGKVEKITDMELEYRLLISTTITGEIGIFCPKFLSWRNFTKMLLLTFIFSFFSFSGEDFFPTSNSLLHGTHVPSKEGVDKMVSDLEKQ